MSVAKIYGPLSLEKFHKLILIDTANKNIVINVRYRIFSYHLLVLILLNQAFITPSF